MSDAPEMQEIVCNDRRVTASGRVTIPETTREKYDIDVGDYVDFYIVGDGYEFGSQDMKVQNRHRLQLEKKKRERYGVEEGDIVDVIIYRDV